MNNRQTNNRRRGRGNNNRVQNNNRNGFDNQNRIDNRARGNAAQMLEKYKKLAQDAQLNGDRVNAEYYLQFADHYFRVLADYKSRQEERRPAREWNDDRDIGDRDSSEFDAEMREDADAADSADHEGELSHSDEADEGRSASYQERSQERGQERAERHDRGDRNERSERGRGRRPDNRSDSRPPRRERPQFAEEGEQVQAGLDLAVLPPAIGVDAEEPSVAAEKPARKPRARKPKITDDEVATAAE